MILLATLPCVPFTLWRCQHPAQPIFIALSFFDDPNLCTMSTPAASLRNPSASYDVDSIDNDGSSTRRGNALSNKLTSVLSSSYADSEIRDALRLYDARYGGKVGKDVDLKYEAQKEVIEANGRIVDDFSKVAKVFTRKDQRHDSAPLT